MVRSTESHGFDSGAELGGERQKLRPRHPTLDGNAPFPALRHRLDPPFLPTHYPFNPSNAYRPSCSVYFVRMHGYDFKSAHDIGGALGSSLGIASRQRGGVRYTLEKRLGDSYKEAGPPSFKGEMIRKALPPVPSADEGFPCSSEQMICKLYETARDMPQGNEDGG
ncbi:unnamed protein product [Victoria cruziana]